MTRVYGRGSQTRSLGEENSSLRALNMSLIYEREQILGQIKHSDAEIAALQVQTWLPVVTCVCLCICGCDNKRGKNLVRVDEDIMQH